MATFWLSILAGCTDGNISNGIDTLVVDDGDPPEIVSIELPAFAIEDETVLVTGQVTDPDQPTVTLLVTLYVAASGDTELEPFFLGNPEPGGFFSWEADLAAGTYIFALEVEDGLGNSADLGITDAAERPTLLVEGVNQPPLCTINSPSDLSVFSALDPIVFDGTVTDPNEDASGHQVLWFSDGVTPIFVGRSFGSIWPYDAGEHVVSMGATDGFGASCLDEVTITIVE